MSQVAEPVMDAESDARPRLRRAALDDAGRLAALFSSDGPAISSTEMEQRLEHGGALFFEDAQGPVSAVSWSDGPGGWQLSRPALRAGQAGDSHSRWLMTQVESLAIRMNIPRLSLENTDPADLHWYRRMGYEEQPGKSGRLAKRVGGTWQYRTAAV